MRAITYKRYGPPEVLGVETIDRPEPREGEVRIRVRAAEATKADCEMRSFRFQVKWFWLPLRLAVGVFRPRRRVLGGYFAGEVDRCGEGVTRFSHGQAVFGVTGLGMGAYAEYVCVPASNAIVAKPESMSFAEAAAVPLGGLNALHFMRRAAIRAGERVLIVGAGGSIGAHAVMIAKSMGAHVIAVDAAIKRPLLDRLGIDAFIDYRQDDFTKRDERFDVIFDMVPSTSFGACIRMLEPGGRYLCGNPRLSVMLRSWFTSRFTDKKAIFAFARETEEELATLARMIDAGEITPIVDRVLPMTEAAAAHHRVETEQRIGAVVLSADFVPQR